MAMTGSDLLHAAQYGKTEEIQKALAGGVDINYTDASGKTALMQACGYGFLESVKILLENGADVNKVESDIGATALIAAAVCCYADIINLLLENGADINAASSDGMSSLMFCAHKGSVECVKVLLKHNPDVNHTNRYGESALMRGCTDGSTEIVQLLIDADASLDIKSTEHGLTPLMIAADNGHEALVKLLVEAGADPDIHSLGLRTAADYARLKGFNAIVSLLSPDVEIEIPKTVNRKKEINKEATKALIDAIYSGSLEKAIIALEDGADPKPADEDFPPIVLAAAQGQIPILQLLINLGADVNATDVSGISGLVKACGGCYTDVVKLLLENGAEVTQDVMMATSIHKPQEILKLLHKGQLMMGNPTVDDTDSYEGKLLIAAAKNDEAVVEEMLFKKVNVNAVDKDGAPALLWAARKNNLSIIKILLKRGADPDIQSEHGWTAIMEASLCGHLEVVTALIKGGADVNIATAAGACSIIFASAEGNTDVVKLLLENGANPDAVISKGPNEGMTALKYAQKGGYTAIIKLLQSD